MKGKQICGLLFFILLLYFLFFGFSCWINNGVKIVDPIEEMQEARDEYWRREGGRCESE